MPVTFDDSFFDDLGASLPALSVKFLNRAASWSARNSKSGFVPSWQAAQLSDDPDRDTGPLQAAGVMHRVKGGWRITEGIGITVVNADKAAAAQPESSPAAPAHRAVQAPGERTPGARRVALHRAPSLTRAVRERDAGQCRYCAAQVRWGRGRAPDSGTWDWVEPDGPMSAENVVTACKACGEAKAGRSLKEAGMTLLPVPQARNASCNASDLGCNASGPPSNASRNAYSGETAGQKRYTRAVQADKEIDQSKSDQDLYLSGPVEQQPLTARARKAKPGTPEFRKHIIAKFTAVTGTDIGPDTADAIAADVLGERKGIVNALSYVFAAIVKEKDPAGRWLPRQAPQAQQAAPAARQPAPLEWCGECDQIDRTVYDEELRRITHCPNCSPKSFAAHIAPQEAAA